METVHTLGYTRRHIFIYYYYFYIFYNRILHLRIKHFFLYTTVYIFKTFFGNGKVLKCTWFAYKHNIIIEDLVSIHVRYSLFAYFANIFNIK